MDENTHISIFNCFEDIYDPRVERTKKHKLLDILFLSLTAVMCGADSFVEIENFGKSTISFFEKYIDTTNGIPSHDTIGRIFSVINPDQFRESFLKWVSGIVKTTKGKVVSIDGKSIRGTNNPLHMVNVWIDENSVLFGQMKVESKLNEINAIEKLLKILDLKGAIITIDAIGTQKDIVAGITDQKADYVIALKTNQGKFYEGVKTFFDLEDTSNERLFDVSETIEKSRNRIEKRVCTTTQDEELLKFLDPKKEWKGLKTVVKVSSMREIIGGEKSSQDRYFISSLDDGADFIAKVVRKHWSIENKLHWVLDISFREDDTKVRIARAVENLSMLKKIALSVIKQEKSKGSMKGKRNRAGWNSEFREKLLGIVSG